MQGHPQLCRLPLEICPDSGIGRHASGDGQLGPAGLPQSLHGPGHQHLADRQRKAGAEGRDIQLLPFLLGIVNQIQSRRFQAREGHIQRIAAELCVGHGISGLVAGLGHAVQGCAAGIGHTQHTGHLVKALPRRVIPGGAQNVKHGIILHVHNQAVAAGDHQAQKGRLQIGTGQIVCGNVSPDVVNRDQRHIQGQSRRLGKVDSHQHRPDQARRVGHSHGVQIASAQAGGFQSLIRQAVDGLDMLPGGNFRHHTAIELVQLHLRRDAVGQHPAPVLHNGHGRFVTGGFHRQNFHSSHSFLSIRASSLGLK